MSQNKQLAGAPMSRVMERTKLPRGLLAAFVARGCRLRHQDRALEKRRRTEPAESSLECAAAAIQSEISVIQRRLASGSPWQDGDASPDAVLLHSGAGELSPAGNAGTCGVPSQGNGLPSRPAKRSARRRDQQR
jgi:hypothetical protein